jgi:hypothetical protein
MVVQKTFWPYVKIRLSPAFQSCTHQTGKGEKQFVKAASHGSIILLPEACQSLFSPMTLPNPVSVVHELQLAIPAIGEELSLDIPVRIHPEKTAGGPEPESAAVRPFSVS